MIAAEHRLDVSIAIAEQRLPQWSAIADNELLVARKYRDASKVAWPKVRGLA
jgi:hypothetical protein